ncbi:unnamed protein product [Callosobruchus maculatus]|uniref:Pickpocket protein 28 n=1 Tax=Callosobruchus maculatus TaxID=64391 RepID=A0A653CMP5_CALMS|nr:unnamed protein product [Callosobruchus maculatus]
MLTFLQSRPYILKYCEYLDQVQKCRDNFTPILTEEGVCYSFNILDKADMFRDNVEFILPNYHSATSMKNWEVEKGYTASEIDAYPRRALRVGQKNALSIMLKTKKEDIEFLCAGLQSGYRINVHFPSVYPDVTQNFFTVPLGQSVTGLIIPEMIRTSEGVKQFHPKTRDCYFQSERPLKFFKVYSQTNCLMECKANYTLRLCGCVGFWMPKAEGTPICIMMRQFCVEDVVDNTFFAVSNDYSLIEDKSKYSNLTQCDCLPMCTDITYKLELSQNPITFPPAFPHHLQIMNGDWLDLTHFSILTLYFKNNHIETRERNELYSLSDVIANFGGLLGLFTGFSILSAIEIIYFLSLRIWGNIKLFSNWSGSRKEISNETDSSKIAPSSDIYHMC